MNELRRRLSALHRAFWAVVGWVAVRAWPADERFYADAHHWYLNPQAQADAAEREGQC